AGQGRAQHRPALGVRRRQRRGEYVRLRSATPCCWGAGGVCTSESAVARQLWLFTPAAAGLVAPVAPGDGSAASRHRCGTRLGRIGAPPSPLGALAARQNTTAAAAAAAGRDVPPPETGSRCARRCCIGDGRSDTCAQRLTPRRLTHQDESADPMRVHHPARSRR
ncbi:hypothetical protein V498_10646, partial [Pseudogymnoascus sp. VKM F-4517 (FW-2822)]